MVFSFIRSFLQYSFLELLQLNVGHGDRQPVAVFSEAHCKRSTAVVSAEEDMQRENVDELTPASSFLNAMNIAGEAQSATISHTLSPRW